MNRTRVDPGPSDSTLKATPARVLPFLIAIGTRASIRAAMHDAGYGIQDHNEGWRLLMAVGDIRHADAALEHCQAADALHAVHEWVNNHFRRYRVALERLQPEAAYLFPDIDSRYPAQALLALANLLQHLQTAGNESVLALLAQRGLSASELAQLGQQVQIAQSIDMPDEQKLGVDDDRTPELTELYYWYRDWVESAKRFVKRKDHWKMLGIGTKGLP